MRQFLTNKRLAIDLLLPTLILLLTATGGLRSAVAATKTCESLAQLNLPNTKITAAQPVTAGEFTVPGRPASIKGLPPFCRVAATLTPSADSDIKIEVWFPLTAWNGKYRGQGNGGFAGAISFETMASAIKLGYATAGTDTGHGGNDAAWALGHREKVVDFGWRAIHEMTLTAKAIIQNFYGESPKRSYFSSCSDGGREALMEAQRFPADYDGIIAGAPANYWSRLLTAGMVMQTVTLNGDDYIPASKLPAITYAVMNACDALDSVKDGLLTDPRQCPFDPAVLICKGADSDSCLTVAQARALKSIYAGLYDGGRLYLPGYAPGSEESGWNSWITGPMPRRSIGFFFGSQFFANMVYEKADWDYLTFNFAEASKLAESKTAAALDATDPNLSAFMKRGGKLIMYHGWNDPAIPPLNTINYFESVLARMGKSDSGSFMRLFMVPGMGHCGGGPGPNAFGQGGPANPDDPEHNIYRALEQWVEQGVAPERLTATKYNDDRNPALGIKMTRPLCAYPGTAKYKGSGDPNDAINFVCAPAPK
jgi:feruloyl esterase